MDYAERIRAEVREAVAKKFSERWTGILAPTTPDEPVRLGILGDELVNMAVDEVLIRVAASRML